jgi:LysM repeat protein
MIKIIFLTVFSWSGPTFPMDSLRTETINGKVFIIHQVDEHETLYGISRRYAVPLASLVEFNPTADGGLEVGQILKVPYVAKSNARSNDGLVHKVVAKETLFSISKLYNVSVDDIKSWNNLTASGLSTGQSLLIRKKAGVTTTPVGKEEVSTPVTGKRIHIVAAKETLFAISRKYGITMQQLREWNALQGDDVKVGDVLMVAAPKGYVTTEEIKPVVKEVIKTDGKEEARLPVREEVKPEDIKVQIPKENPILISESVRGSDEVKEGGLAELIEGTEGNRKYLALHRTAKLGTILKVRNELNNREVFVRVVGSLPATGVNDKLIIKISKSAYDRLGAIDAKFRAEVTYYK